MNKLNYWGIVIVCVIFILFAMLFLGGFGLHSDVYGSFIGAQCPFRESLFKYGFLIGWDIYRAGGQPTISEVSALFFEPCYFLYLISDNANISATLCSLIYVLFGTIGMYLLVFKLTNNNKSSVLSCIFFWFWLSSARVFSAKHIWWIVPTIMLPWIFLSYENMGDNIKKIIKNSIFIGIIFTIIFLAYGLTAMVWIFFIFPIYILTDVFYRNNLLFKIKKLGLILLIIVIVFAGLSAFVMYPSVKFIEKSSRDESFSLNQFIGDKLEIREFFKINIRQEENWMKTGITALSIVGIGLFLGFKKKNFLKYFIIFLLGIVITSNLFSIASLLVKIPILNKTRHIIRFAVIYHFSFAVLIGLSFNYISKNLKKYAIALFILIVVLLSFELYYIHIINNPEFSSKGRVIKEEIGKYTALEYISNIESERFRIHMLGKDWVEGNTGEPYFCTLGIESMDWAIGNAWLVDYTAFTHLAGSNLNQAPKLWGILNTKYVIAESPEKTRPVYTKDIFNYINGTGYSIPKLRLIKTFPPCDTCYPDIIFLYENKRFLPRIFLVNKSILILGEKDKLYNLYSFLLLNDNFDPKTTVLITKNDIGNEKLDKYSAIIISRQPNPEEAQKLQQFKSSGGTLLPDIFNNENQIDVEKLNTLLQEWNKNSKINEFKEVYYSPNHRIYETKENLKGFAVVSENFYTYRDEWLATLNSKNKEIYSANFVVSAIYLDDEKGELEFRYTQKYFKIGGSVSIITLLIIIIVLIKWR